MQTLYAEIGYKISRYAQMCNNSLYKKRNLEKETNLEEAPIGKLDMNKFAPLADLGEDNDKSEKEPIEKFLFQQNKWNNSYVSQSDSYTFTSQMGENRRRKSNHQKANTSVRQINQQNKFASLNSEDSSSNSGNFISCLLCEVLLKIQLIITRFLFNCNLLLINLYFSNLLDYNTKVELIVTTITPLIRNAKKIQYHIYITK
ncbi:Hypothetical_protein [Hexamita inflata]|uniref:Hypothetical_protein n=1 Tax=Hexamita inflata TaxID=28002 RepID=A0AA86Q0N8_9EUKA|nr:Hypothetical protein HINF_LOCUS37505 [Hexamita inflata]